MPEKRSHTNASLIPRLMIIDDSPIDRFIAEKAIDRFAFSREVISMASASEALRFLQAQQSGSQVLPQLILLDICMPEMDGFAFLEAFKALPPFIRDYCTIIILTSSTLPGENETAMRHPNVEAFFSKPLNEKKLLEINFMLLHHSC